MKLQIINLAAKLFIVNPKQTTLLCQYVFNLAKYDQNYDIRDRTRFLRHLIMPAEKGGALSKHAKKILLASKPAPVLQSKFKGFDNFTAFHCFCSNIFMRLRISRARSISTEHPVSRNKRKGSGLSGTSGLAGSCARCFCANS